MSRNLYVVIVGCGRLGSLLANRLSQIGHSVVVVDHKDAAFENLDPAFSGFRVEGDATELGVLRQARMDKADLVIATTREDNVNLMVVQVAREVFSVPCVLARAFDPRRQEVYLSLGVTTICPTTVAADLFLLAIESPGTSHGGTES
jgi:trk system potassium uptake protein TrkA